MNNFIILTILIFSPIFTYAIDNNFTNPYTDIKCTNPFGDDWGKRTIGVEFPDGSSVIIWNY